MSLYRKKPVVIEAFRWTGDADQTEDPLWIIDAIKADVVRIGGFGSGLAMRINTLEGDVFARPGDWIIQGVKGEIYPCKPDIFAETYQDARVSPGSVCTRRTCKLSGDPIPPHPSPESLGG